MSSQEAFGFDRSDSGRPDMRRPETARAGNLLPFGAKMAPVVCQQYVPICCGGREFTCSVEMAECFLRKARLTIDSHNSELIPILHAGGLELLLIAENIPFTVGAVFEHTPRMREN